MIEARLRGSRTRCLWVGVWLFAVLWGVGSSFGEPGLTGRPLGEALRELREEHGLNVVFTSTVVPSEMVVREEPVATEPRARLEELLAQHDLRVEEGARGVLIVVPDPAANEPFRVDGRVVSRWGEPIEAAFVKVSDLELEVESDVDGSFSLVLPPGGPYTIVASRAGYVVGQLADVTRRSTDATLVLDSAPLVEEELLVTPSRVQLLREQPVARLDLSRDQMHALPHLGGDVFRALSLLPGVSANDVSARFHVRGGRRDETRVLLDGQELYEVYHLQDFDSALSVVAPTTLEKVDLLSGGFPAEHGDRMSGVLDMTTVSASTPLEGVVGVGLLSVNAGGAGRFARERGGWVIQARRGAIDLASRLLGNEDPQYWDAFAKLDFRFGDRSSVRANLLHADDRLKFEESLEDDSKRIETDYASSYVWVSQQALLGSSHLLESALSTARIDRDRLGVELEEDVEFSIRDRRRLDVLSARQHWSARAFGRHTFKGGYEIRRFDTAYDYVGDQIFENPIAEIRERGSEATVEFLAAFEESHYSAHFSDRIRIREPLTLELGLRYDRHTQTDESLVSPRLNFAWAAGQRSVLRFAWGRFAQSQRPYELQVEDGETRFSRVERSEHRVLGFERIFPRGEVGRDLVVRAEVYRREVTNPRPRFENLYEPINTFPEAEPDRVRIAPSRALAEGVEIFARGPLGKKAQWWANYTYSETRDRLGGRWAPRSFDQTHSLNLDLDLPLGRQWRLNLAWRWHTGWPTTELRILEELDEETGETEFEPILGPLFAERLPSYHRLDLRASRTWQSRAGEVTLYVDIQNVYDRENIAGFDYELDDDEGVVVRSPEPWAGFFPSAGVSLSF